MNLNETQNCAVSVTGIARRHLANHSALTSNRQDTCGFKRFDSPSGLHSEPGEVGLVAERATVSHVQRQNKMVMRGGGGALLAPRFALPGQESHRRQMHKEPDIPQGHCTSDEDATINTSFSVTTVREGTEPDIDKKTERNSGYLCLGGRRKNAKHAAWSPKLTCERSKNLQSKHIKTTWIRVSSSRTLTYTPP